MPAREGSVDSWVVLRCERRGVMQVESCRGSCQAPPWR